MQEELSKRVREYVYEIEKDFQEIQGGSFVDLRTGEIITKSEHDKIIQLKLENFKCKMLSETNQTIFNEFGIENTQALTNKKTSKKKQVKTRDRHDNGEFNIVYRNKVEEILKMKLSSNEKLVYYILRDFVQYPTNFVVIADTLPTTKQLEKLVGLSEKSIIGALKSLEDKKIIKRKQVGHKKAIVVNPDYYASGKDLEVDTLAMFGLIEVREDIIDTYLEELKIN